MSTLLRLHNLFTLLFPAFHRKALPVKQSVLAEANGTFFFKKPIDRH